MASITDCVVEGLKYPFNDVKRAIGFGVLFAVLNVLAVARGIKSVDIFRPLSNASGDTLWIRLSQIPSGEIAVIAVLAAVSFIVMLFIMGYQYDILKFSIDKKQDLPGFGDIAGILVKGIKCFIVTVAYNVIPTVIMVGGILSLNEPYGQYLVLISIILYIIVFFILIMALNNMVAYDNLSKAFDFEDIIGKISNLGWGKYVGIIIFTLIVFLIIMLFLVFILSMLAAVLAMTVRPVAVMSAVMGVIEGLFVTSYGSLFYNRVLGSIYRESVKQ